MSTGTADLALAPEGVMQGGDLPGKPTPPKGK